MDPFSEETLAGPLPIPTLEAPIADRAGGEDIDVPFTAAAQRVLDRCVDSLSEGDDAVLTDSLFRAISETPESAAAQLMEEHGQSGEKLLTALQALLGRGATDAILGSTPRLERVVIRAKREAFRRRHSEVSTLHLLMALLRERSASPLSILH